LIPCFDQPNFICDFEFFYTEKIKDDKIFRSKEHLANKTEIHLIANNLILAEVNLKTEKEKILNNFLFEKHNLKIFKTTQNIIANANKISLIKRNINSFKKIFEIKTSEKNIDAKSYSVNINYEENFEMEIKALIKNKVQDFLILFKLVYEWFSEYFGFLPQRTQLAVPILKELNKQITSNQGAIIMDISGLNPNYDVIEKNYLNFLLVHQM
jgi:hypothetical protein